MKTASEPSLQHRKLLRQQLRAKRRGLSKSQQLHATRQITRRLRSHPVFLRSKHVAFYMAEDGEINAHDLICAAEKMGKKCYLPILNPLKHSTLWFGRYRKGDMLSLNYFGLAEPPAEKPVFSPKMLDLVLMPLVGFDRKGNRLGMGGGFYDRTFAFKNNMNYKLKAPVLMGLAHHCQETSELSKQDWDVAFDYIATDKEVFKILK